MRKVSIGYYSEPVLFDKLHMLPIWEHQIIFEVDAARSYNLYLHIYSHFPLISQYQLTLLVVQISKIVKNVVRL